MVMTTKRPRKCQNRSEILAALHNSFRGCPKTPTEVRRRAHPAVSVNQQNQGSRGLMQWCCQRVQIFLAYCSPLHTLRNKLSSTKSNNKQEAAHPSTPHDDYLGISSFSVVENAPLLQYCIVAVQAAQFVTCAHQAERDQMWELAFTCYKSAVNMMLQGAAISRSHTCTNAWL